MSLNDAIEIEEYYEKKWDDAHRRDFINRRERKLHNKEKRNQRS